jgi:hypothetical protein
MPNAVHDPAAPPVKSLALESKGGNSKLIEVFGSIRLHERHVYPEIHSNLSKAFNSARTGVLAHGLFRCTVHPDR